MDSEIPLPSTQSTQIHRTNASATTSVATLTRTGSANNTATVICHTTYSSITNDTMTTNTTSLNTNLSATVLARTDALPASDV